MSFDVADFQKEVIERSKEKPVLVDFWAEWCAPCRILGPVLEKLAGEAIGDWVLAKVNTEEMPDVAREYNIRSIPNVKLFVDGKPEAEFVGALPEPMLKQWLQKNIPSKSRKEVERAEALLDKGRNEEAATILDSVIKSEPGNHKARVLLALMLLDTDLPRAEELVNPIEEDSDVFDLAEAVRTFAALAHKPAESLPDKPAKETYLKGIKKLKTRDYAAALEAFIEVIRNDREYDNDGSRKACVAIFKVLGEDHDITQQYRREFSRALYS